MATAAVALLVCSGRGAAGDGGIHKFDLKKACLLLLLAPAVCLLPCAFFVAIVRVCVCACMCALLA